MSITRTALTDDSGSGTDGTIINNAWLTNLYNAIDALGGKKEFWIPAKDWVPATNGPCASLATRASGAAYQDYQHLAFDGTTAEVAVTNFVWPKSWNLGTITYKVYWSGIAAGAGGVTWQIGGRAHSDGDTYNVAPGTAVQVNDTFIAIDTVHVSAESAAVTLAGTPVAGDIVRLELWRVPSDAGDTRAADANFIGLRVIYTTAAITDD